MPPESAVLVHNAPVDENVLAEDELLASIELPTARAGTRSRYHKVMDRETWTHAVVSAAVVLEMDQEVCRSAPSALAAASSRPKSGMWERQRSSVPACG